jgi:hypothetical protein
MTLPGVPSGGEPFSLPPRTGERGTPGGGEGLAGIELLRACLLANLGKNFRDGQIRRFVRDAAPFIELVVNAGKYRDPALISPVQLLFVSAIRRTETGDRVLSAMKEIGGPGCLF